MISLIIEICLTCKAWKKGWRGWALLPMAIGLGSAFMIGMMIGASGGDPAVAMGFGLLIDVTIIIALAVMAGKVPQTVSAGNVASLQQNTVAQFTPADEHVAA